MTAEQILSRFPFKEGVYRLVRRDRFLRALRRGWRFVSGHESGRVLMWLEKGRPHE